MASKMVAVPVNGGANFNPGAPTALFQANPRQPVATSEHVTYDVTQEGQRFLINTYVKNGEVQPMTRLMLVAKTANASSGVLPRTRATCL
jgi:hypothetical protein